MPLLARQEQKGKADEIAHANASSQQLSEPRHRPYLLKKLQDGIGTRVLADTLDWDALAHYNLDASVLSLDNVYKGIQSDMETYYFLWVAVRKVLAEARNVMFSGASLRADQKAHFLKELLDGALEQFFAELGNALMNFVEGPHCTIVDARNDGDPDAICNKARSLVARFEKLGRSKDMLMVAIPATESGIEAAARLQREDGINVNLTFVSGVIHATACAQSGAAAVTLPIAEMRDWRRRMNSGDDYDVGGREEDAETIAAYFELHGLSSTGLIIGRLDHVDDACPLAALAALSFDEHQLKKAEWYTEYPQVSLARSDQAVRRAKELPPPPPSPPSPDTPDYSGPVKAMLQVMDAQTFTTFAVITCGNIGGLRMAMTMIANIVRVEIDWQLFLMRPLSSLNAVVTSSRCAASEQPRPQLGSRSGIPVLAPAPVRADANVVGPRARGQRDQHNYPGKRKRRVAEVFEAETQAEAPWHRSPPKKRVKHDSSGGLDSYRPAPLKISTALDGKAGGVGQERAAPRRPPTPRRLPELRPPTLFIEAAPYCALWKHLGGRNAPSWSSGNDHDEDRGRAPRRRL